MRAIGQQKAWSEPAATNNGEFRVMMDRYQIQNFCMLKCRDELLYCATKSMWSVSHWFFTILFIHP